MPKQYCQLAGEPVLAHALRALTGHPQIDAAVVVISPEDVALYETPRRRSPVASSLRWPGARPGRPPCWPGIEALGGHAPDRVLIHDAARPFVTAASSAI